ncbi:hypothetical protein [Klebsiella pneumoniae]
MAKNAKPATPEADLEERNAPASPPAIDAEDNAAPAPQASAIDPAKTYLVEVSRVVLLGQAGTIKLTPRHDEIRLNGEMLLAVPADAIVKYEEV